jgi:DNA polymerase II
MTKDSIQGYVVYPTYRIVDDETDLDKKRKKALIYLFGRLESGESFLAINNFKPYFYVKKADLDKIGKPLAEFKAKTEESDFKNFEDENVTKIILDVPSDVPKMRKILEEEYSTTCFEADIRFTQRFLIDKDIKGSLEIKGKFKKGNHVDRIYEDPELKGSDWEPKLKTLSIDIETDGR